MSDKQKQPLPKDPKDASKSQEQQIFKDYSRSICMHPRYGFSISPQSVL